jgi:hypothetical protein
MTTTKNLSRDSQCPHRDSNRASPSYEARELTATPNRAVSSVREAEVKPRATLGTQARCPQVMILSGLWTSAKKAVCCGGMRL